VGEPLIVPIRAADDVVRVRQAARTSASALGFSLVDQTKVVTAASELARNAMIHAGGGEAVLEEIHDGGRSGLRITIRDRGPGIEDLDLALRDGFTSGSGLGLGLGGSRRLVNEFAIRSAPGEGTEVAILKWK
jgi:serine/threonine-protein kinase RsbT